MKHRQKRINIINQNLIKLPRSDELDTIIEKLNEHNSGISVKKY